jgi:hypothetical protein
MRVEPPSVERVMGYTVQLRATAYDDNGEVITGRPVTWTSSNPEIAEVDANGMVTGRMPGVAVVTASCEGQIASSTITVMPVPVASVEVTPPTANLLPGESVQLHAVTLDSVGGALTGRTITWTSSDNTIAQVASGLVTAVAPGSVIITATSETKSGTASITVNAPSDPCAPEGARAIGMGSTVQGSLEHTDCPLGDGSYYDPYRFTLTTATTVRIDLVSSAFDAFLYLLSATSVLAIDDDSGTGINARITFSLGPGTYYILANSFGPYETGPYQLTLSPAGGAALEEARTSITEPDAQRTKPSVTSKPVPWIR